MVGSIDYHTMETSQDYSVITTDITEDYQVFKQELTNNGDETTMIGETDSNYKIDKLYRGTEASESKYAKMEDILQHKKGNYEEDNNFLITFSRMWKKYF